LNNRFSTSQSTESPSLTQRVGGKNLSKAVALTIAGSDPSGGAGLQADLKTFQQLGVYGMSVVTLLTVQNTQQVSNLQMVDPSFVAEQLDSVLIDIPPTAIKVGALGTSEMVTRVSEKLRDCTAPIVVDPVMVSKHGHSLVAGDFLLPFRSELLPLAFLVTPNRFEAEQLAGQSITDLDQARNAVRAIQSIGTKNVLLKYGAIDNQYLCLLAYEDQIFELRQPLLQADSLHGTGCVLSAIITAALALGYHDLRQIADHAMGQLSQALSSDARFGHGVHPVETRGLSLSALTD
jgi:hydroxymethylpyrimidine/phosphomethylpyrimidine kinase